MFLWVGNMETGLEILLPGVVLVNRSFQSILHGSNLQFFLSVRPHQDISIALLGRDIFKVWKLYHGGAGV
jgi:hypothetical protein